MTVVSLSLKNAFQTMHQKLVLRTLKYILRIKEKIGHGIIDFKNNQSMLIRVIKVLYVIKYQK